MAAELSNGRHVCGMISVRLVLALVELKVRKIGLPEDRWRSIYGAYGVMQNGLVVMASSLGL